MESNPEIDRFDATAETLVWGSKPLAQKKNSGFGLKIRYSLFFALFLLVLLYAVSSGFQKAELHRIPNVLLLSAFLLTGIRVFQITVWKAAQWNFLNEFLLVFLLTSGLLFLGKFEESAWAILLFRFGDWIQNIIPKKIKQILLERLDGRPEEVIKLDGELIQKVHPKAIQPDDILRIQPGEKIALDGLLHSEQGIFDTRALTGETQPLHLDFGDKVLAGMINLGESVELKVVSHFSESHLTQLLHTVEQSCTTPFKTQDFVTLFSKIYIASVVFLSVVTIILPYLLYRDYLFEDWFLRSLTLLIIGYPLAWTGALSLAFFSGICLALRNGILIRNAKSLDALSQTDTVILDTKGILTQGDMLVREIRTNTLNENQFLQFVAAAQAHATHPIGMAILIHAKKKGIHYEAISRIHKWPDKGIEAWIHGKPLLIGNRWLMESNGIQVSKIPVPFGMHHVYVALDGKFEGTISLAQTIRPEAEETIEAFKQMHIFPLILTQEPTAWAERIAQHTKIPTAYGDLRPWEKMHHLLEIQKLRTTTAYVGEGFKDDSVMNQADIGVILGKWGSESSREKADVVIQNENLYQLVSAIKFGKRIRTIIWQNLLIVLAVKILLLYLGCIGTVNIWEVLAVEVICVAFSWVNVLRLSYKSIR